jgi:hypothetical protein
VGAREHRDVRGDLVVARARGVQAPPTGPAISVSRRSTAMWMSSSSGANGERARVELSPHLVEPRSSASRSASEMIAGRGEHAGVGP